MATPYDIALAYLGTGISTIATIGKAPATPWKKFQRRLATGTELQRLFADTKVTGLAIILGTVSGGLYARDFDGDAGVQEYARLLHQHPAVMAFLPVVRTGNGYHVYGRCHEIVRTRVLADGELRCEGGYCLVPPSIHPDTGNPYVLLHGSSIAKAPFISPSFFLGKRIDWKTECDLWTKASSGSAPASPTSPTLPASPASPASPSPSPSPSHTPTTMFNSTLRTDEHAHTVEHEDIWTLFLPEELGERNVKIQALVRFLRTHQKFKGADVELLVDGFRRWHEMALQLMREKSFSINWKHFKRAWTAYRGGILQSIIETASRMPLMLGDKRLSLLANVCYLLSQVNSGKFYMGTLTAAAIVGRANSINGTRALGKLQAHKLIRRLSIGVRPCASEWQWIGPNVLTSPLNPPDGTPDRPMDDTSTLADFTKPETDARKNGF